MSHSNTCNGRPATEGLQRMSCIGWPAKEIHSAATPLKQASRLLLRPHPSDPAPAHPSAAGRDSARSRAGTRPRRCAGSFGGSCSKQGSRRMPRGKHGTRETWDEDKGYRKTKRGGRYTGNTAVDGRRGLRSRKILAAAKSAVLSLGHVDHGP